MPLVIYSPLPRLQFFERRVWSPGTVVAGALSFQLNALEPVDRFSSRKSISAAVLFGPTCPKRKDNPPFSFPSFRTQPYLGTSPSIEEPLRNATFLQNPPCPLSGESGDVLTRGAGGFSGNGVFNPTLINLRCQKFDISGTREGRVSGLDQMLGIGSMKMGPKWRHGLCETNAKNNKKC
jgi:hypothetical protein